MKFCFYTTAISGIINLLVVFFAIAVTMFDGAFHNSDDLLETILELLPLLFFGFTGGMLIRCAIIIRKKIQADRQNEHAAFLMNS